MKGGGGGGAGNSSLDGSISGKLRARKVARPRMPAEKRRLDYKRQENNLEYRNGVTGDASK
jgi:hypothetical protein